MRPAYERPVPYRQQQARESYRQGWGPDNPDRRDDRPAPRPAPPPDNPTRPCWICGDRVHPDLLAGWTCPPCREADR